MCYLCDCNPIDIPEEHDCCEHDPPDCADKPKGSTKMDLHIHDYGNATYSEIKQGRADCVDPACPDRINLIKALLRYGRHVRGCTVFMPSDTACNCGWDQVETLLKLRAKNESP